jgi:hypothetical protein
MIFADWSDINELAVAQKQKWAVYVSNGLEDTPEDLEIWDFILQELAAHYGKETQVYFDFTIGLISGGLFFFENEETADDFYRIFEAPLTDSSAVYACLYDNTGKCLTENT